MSLKKRTCIYINEDLWREFREICLRENHSCSNKIETFIHEYVMRHKAGNTQLRLDVFSDAKRKRCGLCGEQVDHLWEVKYVSGLTFPSCKTCIEDRKKRGLIRKVIRLI